MNSVVQLKEDLNILHIDPISLRKTLFGIYNMGLDEFIECFGKESGEYQWGKYSCNFERNISRWILYLDSNNLKLLTDYLNPKLEAI